LEHVPYYIVITRKNQVLLSFLKIRVVVNNQLIYPLSGYEPVIIYLQQNDARLLATDGFHFSKTLKLHYPKEGTYFQLKVVCAIGDRELLTGAAMLVISYLLGFFTGLLLLKILSFAPILYFLFFYYVNRKDFIQVKQDAVRNHLAKK